MENVLLHICCGICAGGVIDRLIDDGFRVTGFFYNPNIEPEDEYLKRLQVTKEVTALKNIDFLTGEYENEVFKTLVEGREADPEGGQRCALCFRMRLRKTLEKARELDFTHFATTLSISPHKDAATINAIGISLGEDEFLGYDFKQRDGFKKTSDFARSHSLYRQKYCGCIFSRRK